MSRIDKYEPLTGGFRAPLAAAFPVGDLGKAFGVGLDANGRVVVGAGNTGIKGILVLTSVKNAGDIVDVMQDGDLVEFTATDGTAATAGTNYFVDPATGAVSTTNTGDYVGHTVEATRLVVRFGRNA